MQHILFIIMATPPPLLCTLGLLIMANPCSSIILTTSLWYLLLFFFSQVSQQGPFEVQQYYIQAFLKCATNIWTYHFFIKVLLLLIQHDLSSFLYFYQEEEEATRKQVHLSSWKINVFLHYSDLSLISAFEAQKTKICFLTSIWDPEIYMCFRISLICLS